MSEDMEEQKAVIAGLVANGIVATLEFPGCVVIELDPQTTVWTGLNGWEYGTIHRLNGDTMDSTDETAQPDGLSESTEDVDAIVAAWSAWTRQNSSAAA